MPTLEEIGNSIQSRGLGAVGLGLVLSHKIFENLMQGGGDIALSVGVTFAIIEIFKDKTE